MKTRSLQDAYDRFARAAGYPPLTSTERNQAIVNHMIEMGEEMGMGEQWYDRWPFLDLMRFYWRVRSFRLRRIVKEMEMLPTGYGAAYYDWLMDWRVAYPVPLNLAVRAGRWIWWRLKAPRWGDKLLRAIGREKGLRIESTNPKRPHPRRARIYLNGREISNQLRGLDVRMRLDEPMTATLHYVGNIEIPEALGVRERWGNAATVANMLDDAERQGPDTDFPEGVRYITISDTMASNMARQLRGATEVADGDRSD